LKHIFREIKFDEFVHLPKLLGQLDEVVFREIERLTVRDIGDILELCDKLGLRVDHSDLDQGCEGRAV